MRTWSLQDAKARFSELVNRARDEGPQIVSRRGEEAVVVLDVKQYRKLNRRRGRRADDDLVTFFQRSPLSKVDPKLFERDRDTGREIDL